MGNSSDRLAVLRIVLLICCSRHRDKTSAGFPCSEILSAPNPFPTMSSHQANSSSFISNRSFRVPTGNVNRLQGRVNRLDNPRYKFNAGDRSSVNRVDSYQVVNSYLTCRLVPVITRLHRFRIHDPCTATYS